MPEQPVNTQEAEPVCADCDTRLNPNQPGHYRQVTGWTEVRRGGGAHSITLPGAPHAWLCKICMMIRKQGHKNQPTLF